MTVVPTEAGPWSISGSYQTGSGQSDPAPDPRSNYAYWYVDVSPGTPHATPGTIEASLTLMGTDIPVTDAVVLAYLPTDGAFPSQANAWAKPDDSGRFTLSGLVPGRYRLLVLMPDGGPARTQWLSEARTREDASVIELLSGQTRNLGTHPLMRWTGIAGTVLVGSRPVEGAVVSAFATDATWAPLRRAVTGEDGRYDLDLPPGDYQIRVTPPAEEGWSTVWYGGTGARSSAAAVSPSEDRGRHIDLVVAPAATVTGLVSGPGGPVAGARVIFYATSDRYAGSYQTTTTSFGLYEMRDLADDVYRVPASSPRPAPGWRRSGISTPAAARRARRWRRRDGPSSASTSRWAPDRPRRVRRLTATTDS
ncbi:MAG: carboxypeptidase-like regulatory domain-containing protein [Microthrixaceae bacterium]